MRPLLTLWLVVLLNAVLSGCGSLPEQNFQHSARVSIKRVNIIPVGAPDHPQVRIMNPIGAGFGLVGNFVENRRAAGASEALEKTLTAAHYDFRAALTNSIAQAVGKAGFNLTRVEGERAAHDASRFMSRYPQEKKVDAYLDVYATYVGFEAPQSSTAYRPRVELSARLVRAKDNKILFQDRFVYGCLEDTDEETVLVRADDTLSFRNRAALQSDPRRTARALQSAIDATAWELAKQFM